MDVITTYLYSTLDNDTHTKIVEGFKLLVANKAMSQEVYFIKLNKVLYELKQLGHMLYNRLSEILLKEGCKNEKYTHAFSSRNQE